MAQERLLRGASERGSSGPEPIYFALRPEPSAADAAWRRAWAQRAKHGLSGWPVARPRLHVSLQGLCDGADASDELLERTRRAMTLLYDQAAADPEPVEPVQWMVREIHLVRSVFGTGRRIALGRWNLGWPQ